MFLFCCKRTAVKRRSRHLPSRGALLFQRTYDRITMIFRGENCTVQIPQKNRIHPAGGVKWLLNVLAFPEVEKAN